MIQSEAIEKLQRQLTCIDEVMKKPRFSPDFKKWQRDTEIAIEQIFGKNTRHIDDFRSIKYNLVVWSNNTPEAAYDNKFRDGLSNAKALLDSMIDEVREYWKDKSTTEKRDTKSIIQNICNRFHFVAKQMRVRHDDRDTLTIADEYDVQDLFHALLTLEFDDIREEEGTPSHAGSASRLDFLLKEHKIVIELKKTRPGLDAKKIGEQLIIDIQRYQSHPDCQTLICFVYDPDGLIKNPQGIENDLNNQRHQIEVKVIITPKGF